MTNSNTPHFDPLASAFLEAMAAGLWIADPEGRILEVNSAYCKMSGYDREALVRMHIWDLEAKEDSEAVRDRLRLLKETRSDHFESRHRRKGGTVFDVEIQLTWIDSEGGRVAAYCTDISARKAKEQAIYDNEDRLRLALNGAKAGAWTWNLRTGTFLWSPENFDLYGIDPSHGAPNYEEWKGYLHPEDRMIAEQAIRNAIDPRSPEKRLGPRLSHQGGDRRSPEYRVEFRVLHPRHRPRWILAIGRIDRGADGTPLRLSGLHLDITDRKRIEESITENEKCWRELAEAMPQLVWTADTEGVVDYYNRRHEEFCDPNPNASAPWQPILHPEDRWKTAETWRRAIQTGASYEIEHRIQRSDGSFRWYLTRAVPVHNVGGHVVKWYGTSTDVDARYRAEEELKTADRRKDEFLAMLAHELRNPLAPIRNAVHIMGLLDLQNPKLKWVREVIDRQVRHLARLVDDLLDISRIVRGKITLRKERAELAHLVQQAREATRPIIESRKHRLTVKLPAYPVILEGDVIRLTQVLQNLLDNSAKYTQENGEIELIAVAGRRELTITVRDNGIGISQDLLPRVFDLFQQGERGLDRAQGGLGIGLTLVQRLIKLHGGQISVASGGYGQGTAFTIQLPLPEISPAALHATETNTQGKLEGGLRILLVEDDAVVAETTVLWLSMEGHEVLVANTGEAALEKILPFQPHVVLLDIGLPGIDGYTTAERIRALPGGEGPYLVAVTGYGHEEAQTRSRAAGFDYHLVKPVEPAALNALLSALGGV